MRGLAFVTGATGFIGRHLVEQLLTHNWQVRALVRPTSDTRYLEQARAELVTGDLRDSTLICRSVAGCDTVFHLAGLTAGRSEAEYKAANVGGVEAVTRALRDTAVRPRRLVYLSSYAACGPASPGRPRPLDAPPAPLTAYGRTKLAGEAVARAAERDGLELTVIRAPAVYGPGDRALLTYFRLVRWGLAPVPGGAERHLHLVFAPDLATALRRAAHARCGTYAVAEPTVHAWSEVVGTIADAMGKRPLRLRLPPAAVRSAAAASETIGRFAGTAVPFNREKAEEMLAPAWTCDLSLMEELLPPEQVTPLADGFAQTVRWYYRQGWL